ncbi:MAG: hypothetical protein IKJ55_08740 [Clostridia bacterium]|nr:hypothetical protein [Clostridia bacterium]
MKKLICVLAVILTMSVTSSAHEAVETDYVNIKNAVLMYVSTGEYQKAVECIDMYSYTVQSNDWYYSDLQNDRVAISEVMYSADFKETLTMLQTLSRLNRYELALVYIGEQRAEYPGCPNFQRQLGEWETYFNSQLQKSKISGAFTGDGVTLIASTDDVGTVIELLTVQKDGVTIILADAENRGYIYTERGSDVRAEGAYFDSLQNSGMVYVVCEDDGTVSVEITSDGYHSIHGAGTYKLTKQKEGL